MRFIIEIGSLCRVVVEGAETLEAAGAIASGEVLKALESVDRGATIVRSRGHQSDLAMVTEAAIPTVVPEELPQINTGTVPRVDSGDSDR